AGAGGGVSLGRTIVSDDDADLSAALSVLSRLLRAPAIDFPTPAAGAALVAARPAPRPASTMVCPEITPAAATHRINSFMRRVCHSIGPVQSSHRLTSLKRSTSVLHNTG